MSLQQAVPHRAATVLQGHKQLEFTCSQFCLNPLTNELVQWQYAPVGEFLGSESRPLETSLTRLITPGGSLILLDLRASDSGVYYCLDQGSVISVWLLQVDSPADLQVVDAG